MGIAVPSGIEIHRLLQGCLSTISEETPFRKTLSSITLAALPDGANDDVSYVLGNLAIQDVLPDNRDLKPGYTVDQRTCGSHAGQPRRLFPRAALYPLVGMGVKDSVPLCNTMQVPWTAQGAWHQTVEASRFTVRLLIESARDPSTRGSEAAATTSGRFVECDHVASAECSLDVSGCRLRIHPRDTLPCALTMLNATKADSNADTYGVAVPSSRIWRLPARNTINIQLVLHEQSRRQYGNPDRSRPSSPHVWLPSARLHFVTTAAAQQRQALQAALPSPQLCLSKLSG
ncbi:uncharacterized protein LOC142566633 [Dermacentor variabilis]|uniref:uncharacterized protein LOC142566633 n=1 Tax=Dermacentor variabilis TaxID=34621 RepID=UPI003F5B2099